MTEFAREYGEGLFALAQEDRLTDALHEELNALAECFRGEPDFSRLLDTRSVPLEERLRAVDDVLRDRAHPYLVNFVKILCERGAAHAFYDCADYFHGRYNETYGIVDASVTTAVPLSREQADAIRAKLEQISGKQIALLEQVDPQLLGGVRVEWNGRRLDNTIQGRLERLRRALAGE